MRFLVLNVYFPIDTAFFYSFASAFICKTNTNTRTQKSNPKVAISYTTCIILPTSSVICSQIPYVVGVIALFLGILEAQWMYLQPHE